MKLLLILTAVLLGAMEVRAETITCSHVSETKPEITTTITVKDTYLPNSGGMKYLKAFVENDATNFGERLRDEMLVSRRRVKNAFIYEDMTSPNTLQLSLKTTNLSGNGIEAHLYLYKGAPYSKTFQKLDCSVSGQPFPVLPVCPTAEELKKATLNEIFFRSIDMGFIEKIKTLTYDCGADITGVDKKGYAPILRAIKNVSSLNKEKVVGVLRELGADLEVFEPITYKTPLIFAVEQRDSSLTSLLLDAGVDVDGIDFEGNTALMYAATNRDEIMIRTIDHHNPDKTLENNDNKTAYDIAMDRGYGELLDLLKGVTQVVITGNQNGTCSPTMIHVYMGKSIEVVLKASDKDMFYLKAADLSLDLMAMAKGEDKKVVIPNKKGTFPFECGVHGGAKKTKGEFMVM